mmetsp:Transcript_44906/g.106774  ORF Transcript_44906/g.106774 Transcript_44906/m.106774 type:complete len:295 (+) Transcript_44906:1297-2181(+)
MWSHCQVGQIRWRTAIDAAHGLLLRGIRSVCPDLVQNEGQLCCHVMKLHHHLLQLLDLALIPSHFHTCLKISSNLLDESGIAATTWVNGLVNWLSRRFGELPGREQTQAAARRDCIDGLNVCIWSFGYHDTSGDTLPRREGCFVWPQLEKPRSACTCLGTVGHIVVRRPECSHWLHGNHIHERTHFRWGVGKESPKRSITWGVLDPQRFQQHWQLDRELCDPFQHVLLLPHLCDLPSTFFSQVHLAHDFLDVCCVTATPWDDATTLTAPFCILNDRSQVRVDGIAQAEADASVL